MKPAYPSAIRHLHILAACQDRTVREVWRLSCAESGCPIGLTTVQATINRLARQGCVRAVTSSRPTRNGTSPARWHLTGWGRQVLATAATVCQAALREEGVTQ